MIAPRKIKNRTRVIAMGVLLFLLALLPANLQGQESLDGWVIDQKKETVIPEVHVINKRTLKGTVTDDEGFFSIQLSWGDTIIFSNIAYKYLYFVYADSTTALHEVIIKLEEQNYLLSEVSVFDYKLTTNKPKAIKLNKPRIPTNEEIPDDEIMPAQLFNPAEFLYNLFGSKPRQLRKLAQLKAEDAYRDKLKESNNREAVVQLTGLSIQELEAFMFYCKYAAVRMHTLNDYEFLLSVQNCFRRYVKERELENFLRQFD